MERDVIARLQAGERVTVPVALAQAFKCLSISDWQNAKPEDSVVLALAIDTTAAPEDKRLKTDVEDLYQRTILPLVQWFRLQDSIVIVTGAGLSAPVMPVFSGPDGLFAWTKERFGVEGHDVFDYDYFQSWARVKDGTFGNAYYRVMMRLWDASRKHSLTYAHKFIAELSNAGRLLHCFTSNIDTLHRLSPGHLTEIHGRLEGMNCVLNCNRYVDEPPTEEQLALMHAGQAPLCAGTRRGQKHPMRFKFVMYGADPLAEQYASSTRATMKSLGKFPVLVVVGSSLRTPSVENLVKDLAMKAGKVIFVESQPLNPTQKRILDRVNGTHVQATSETFFMLLAYALRHELTIPELPFESVSSYII